MIFRPKTHIVLFDTQSPKIETDEMLDIILTPSFYWVKRVELPVKYMHEVRRLLPSLFDDILPEGEYSYSAYRDGDSYLIFAYDDKAIVKALNEKGIKSTHISKVYLAQSEFGSQEKAIALGKDAVMMVRNGVLLRLPAYFSEEKTMLDLDRHKFSSHHIPLARYSHIADKKSMMLFSSFMLILILSLVAEWSIVYSKIQETEMKRDELFDSYELKSTMMQNQAILDRLEQRYERQSKIRKISASLYDLRMEKAEKMSYFDVTVAGVKASFTISSVKRVEEMAAQLQQAGLLFTKKYSRGVLDLEFAL